MAKEIIGSYISVDESNMISKKSKVQQLVDIVQSDVCSAGSTNTRKKYQVFVSGGTGLTNITSSLYQTVFDQDHSLQTSNSMFDCTVGLYPAGTTYTGVRSSVDSGGKDIFPNTSLMMREKANVYRQYALNLLGEADGFFKTPFDTPNTTGLTERIDEAIFINFRRLFTRDNIVKESFAMRLYQSASFLKDDAGSSYTNGTSETNLSSQPDVVPADSNSLIKITDSGANSSRRVTAVAGEVGTLKIGSTAVGLIFYDSGILVLDAKKVFDGDQIMRGLISDVNVTSSSTYAAGIDSSTYADAIPYNAGEGLLSGSFIPKMWQSGSIDDIVDHILGTRFDDGNLTSMAFKNETFINSSLIFCRAAPSQLNYSTNPTYLNADGKIRVITEDSDEPFSYVTTIGLHDAEGRLLAVAKTSRPIEKNSETDLSIRIRLDY